MESQSTNVFWQPIDTKSRLSALGLKEADLRDAALYGMRHALMCTRHDPLSLPGVIAWGKSIRFLRDRLVPLGWQPDNARNYATVLDPKGTLAVAAAAGDAWTGKHGPNQHPATRSAKGPATRDAVGVNMQLRFADISDSFPAPKRIAGVATWLLLYFWDESADELRVELSLPANVNDQGYVTAWHERIILNPVPLPSQPKTRTDESESESGEDDITIEQIG